MTISRDSIYAAAQDMERHLRTLQTESQAELMVNVGFHMQDRYGVGVTYGVLYFYVGPFPQNVRITGLGVQKITPVEVMTSKLYKMAQFSGNEIFIISQDSSVPINTVEWQRTYEYEENAFLLPSEWALLEVEWSCPGGSSAFAKNFMVTVAYRPQVAETVTQKEVA